MLKSIAKFCFHHFIVVILFWIILLVGVVGVSASVGADWLEQGTLNGTESKKAVDVLNAELPDIANQASEKTGRIVFQSKDVIKNHEAEIQSYLDKIFAEKSKTKIESVASPFVQENAYQISKDGTIGV